MKSAFYAIIYFAFIGLSIWLYWDFIAFAFGVIATVTGPRATIAIVGCLVFSIGALIVEECARYWHRRRTGSWL